MGPLPTHAVKEKSHETALIRYFLFYERDKTFIAKKKKKKKPCYKEVSQTVTCSHKILFSHDQTKNMELRITLTYLHGENGEEQDHQEH